MRRRIAIFLTLAVVMFVAIAIANYSPFTPSAYWTNNNTFLGMASTYMISQTNLPGRQ